jgi:plastocyanin
MKKKTVILCMMIPVFLLAGCQGRTISLSASPPQAAAKTTAPGTAAKPPASPAATPAAATIPAAYKNPATVEGDVQTVTSRFTARSYAPITVQVGIPVKWTIQVAQGNLTGCNNAVIIRQFDIGQRLKVGDTVIEFTPEKTGTIPYSCWMGMIRSSITVVDDLGGGI